LSGGGGPDHEDDDEDGDSDMMDARAARLFGANKGMSSEIEGIG